MTKRRVPIFQQPRSSVVVEDGATAGAMVGRNLVWPDGTVVRVEDLRPAVPPEEGDPAVVYWRVIQEVPAHVQALAATGTTGLYVITGSGTSATREITSDTLDVENGSGVAGNPRINALVRRIAGDTVSALRVVFEDETGIAHLDPTDDDQVAALIGISITAGEEGAEIRVRTSGTIDDAGWSWTPGFVFAGADGTLTQTPPVAGWEIVIGYAPSATRLNLTFDEPVLLA